MTRMSTTRALLQGLVGEVGVQALTEASKRVPGLDAACLPRALQAWLNLASINGYDGPLPGLDDGELWLVKHDEVYSGRVSSQGQEYHYRDVDLTHVAAAVGALVGARPDQQALEIPPVVLVKLGKTVDALVSVQVLAKTRANESDEPVEEPPAPEEYEFEHDRDETGPEPVMTVYALARPSGEHCGKAVLVDHNGWRLRSLELQDHDRPMLRPRMVQVLTLLTGDQGLAKREMGAEGPGPAAAPLAQNGPIAPTPPKAVAPGRGGERPTLPRRGKLRPNKPPPNVIPGLTRLKLSEKGLQRPCAVCSGAHVQAQTFTGCYCLRGLEPLAKSHRDGVWELTLGSNWPLDAVLVLIQAARG